MKFPFSEDISISIFIIGFLIGVYGFCESRFLFLLGFIILGIGFTSMTCQDSEFKEKPDIYRDVEETTI